MSSRKVKPPHFPYNKPTYEKYGYYNCWSCYKKNVLDTSLNKCLYCHNPSPTRAGTELMIEAMNNVPYPGPEDDDELHLQDAKTRYGIITKFQAISAIFSKKLNDIRSYVEGIIESFEDENVDE
jgi:hypothetical protein